MADFYERYESLCRENGMSPVSQNTANLWGKNRATITGWKQKERMPYADVIIKMAQVFGVTADYILGLSDEKKPGPQIYQNLEQHDSTNASANAIATSGGVAHAVANATPAADLSELGDIQNTYPQLDMVDKIRVQAYITGLLAADKYRMH